MRINHIVWIKSFSAFLLNMIEFKYIKFNHFLQIRKQLLNMLQISSYNCMTHFFHSFANMWTLRTTWTKSLTAHLWQHIHLPMHSLSSLHVPWISNRHTCWSSWVHPWTLFPNLSNSLWYSHKDLVCLIFYKDSSKSSQSVGPKRDHNSSTKMSHITSFLSSW